MRVACQSDNRCLAQIDGTTKYVHHFGNRPDEVFDLATDPDERHNLIDDVDPERTEGTHPAGDTGDEDDDGVC